MHARSLNLLLLLAGAIWLVKPGPALAQEREQGEREIASLISQLGRSVNFEGAVIRLSEIGGSVKVQVQAALSDESALIRRRAKLVLGNIARREHARRLQAIANGEIDGSALPGWIRFSHIVGNSPEARQLFVEMHLAEFELLSAYDLGHIYKAKTLLNARCCDYNNSRQKLSPGLIAAVLFLACDHRMELTPSAATNICRFLGVTQSAVNAIANRRPRACTDHLRDYKHNTLLRRLIGKWMFVPCEDMPFETLAMKCKLAMDCRIPEGIDLAAHLIASGSTPANTKYFAILTIGELGTRRHVKLLEPLLDNNQTVAFAMWLFFGGRPAPVCDYALGTMVHLSGQDFQDYHFTTSGDFAKKSYLERMQSIRFANEADRVKGIRAWRGRLKDKATIKRPEVGDLEDADANEAITRSQREWLELVSKLLLGSDLAREFGRNSIRLPNK